MAMGKHTGVGMIQKALVLTCAVISLSALGCATGHCRKAQTPVDASVNTASGSLRGASKAPASTADRVIVFKYDGSLQCNMGKPVSVEEMRKDLKGIPIYSAEKKSDGQMHIQVCGSITGQTNTYEISRKDLKTAEKRGFKEWTFE